MSTTGSCLCRAVRVAYDGEPLEIAICHCTDCRRTSAFPIYKIPKDAFRITHGSEHVKAVETPATSGSTVGTFFCRECGTTIYRTGPLAGVDREPNVHLRAGVLDDVEMVNGERMKPELEVWAERRPVWMRQVQGAVQREQ